MLFKDVKNDLPKEVYKILSKEIKELRPSQEKAVKKGLFKKNNLLIYS